MDFHEACTILSIDPPFSPADLKKSYYKSALRHHPDHNIGNDKSKSTEQFQKVGEAYSLLGKYLELETEEFPLDSNYDIIINKLIQSLTGISINNSSLINIFKGILEGCHKISLKTFENLDKNSAIRMYRYVEQFSSVTGTNEELLIQMKKIIREKSKKDTIITLNPNIDNLFNQDIFKLQHNNTEHYIPLWHDEVSYDLSGSSLIVKCVQDLPKHVSIDHNSDIHVHVSLSFNNIFTKTVIDVKLGRMLFEIPVCDLKIRKRQIYTFKKNGIPKIDLNDAFSTKHKGNIIVHLELVE